MAKPFTHVYYAIVAPFDENGEVADEFLAKLPKGAVFVADKICDGDEVHAAARAAAWVLRERGWPKE